jgi:hypothetical protein
VAAAHAERRHLLASISVAAGQQLWADRALAADRGWRGLLLS